MPQKNAILATCLWLLAFAGQCTETVTLKLENSERVKGALGEINTSQTYAPNIRVWINEREDAMTTAPSELVFYALPNGNTIEHTIGRAQAAGLDWHYYIQQIGAQTRRLRELEPSRNWIVVYLQHEKLSWPSWRKQHSNNPQLARALIEKIRDQFAERKPTVHLLAHSGGGGLLFSVINASEKIPDYVRTIAWLDANYAFVMEEQHDSKLAAWLESNSRNRLVVLAYDDRYITLNGKRVVSDTGGTFRSTARMHESISKRREMTSTTIGTFIEAKDAAGQVDMRIHLNAENKILHTVLVEKNGFLHVLAPEAGDKLWGEKAYEKWILKE